MSAAVVRKKEQFIDENLPCLRTCCGLHLFHGKVMLLFSPVVLIQ